MVLGFHTRTLVLAALTLASTAQAKEETPGVMKPEDLAPKAVESNDRDALEVLYENANINLFIPDNPAPATVFSFDVNDDSVIADLRIHIKLRHTYVGDLTLSVVHPDGTTVILRDVEGGSNDDIDQKFGRDGTQVAALSGLMGKYAAGTWKVMILDNAGQDTGTLDFVQLATVRAK